MLQLDSTIYCGFDSSWNRGPFLGFNFQLFLGKVFMSDTIVQAQNVFPQVEEIVLLVIPGKKITLVL